VTRNTEAQDAETRDVETRDVETRDVETRDAEAPDAEARDAEAQDAEGRDAEARDAETYPYPKDVPYPPPGGQAGGDDESPEANEDARDAAELTDAEADLVDSGGPVDEAEPTEAETDASDDDVEAAAVEIADQQDEAEAAGPERDELPEDPTSADMATPDMATPDMATPDMATPDMATPDTATPDMATPDTAMPDRAVGVAPVAEENKSSVWSEDAATEARRRWHEVQMAFVDDPRAATEQARELVTSTVDSFVAALTKQREALDEEHHDEGADTELLRLEMRRYREVLDRVLGA